MCKVFVVRNQWTDFFGSKFKYELTKKFCEVIKLEVVNSAKNEKICEGIKSEAANLANQIAVKKMRRIARCKADAALKAAAKNISAKKIHDGINMKYISWSSTGQRWYLQKEVHGKSTSWIFWSEGQ